MAVNAMSDLVKDRLQSAAQALHTVDPVPVMAPLLDRTFSLPQGAPEYAANTLTPGAVPFEPSFSEREADALRFTLEPLPPGASPVARQQEATREMRRLVAPRFGSDALRWFDRCSEEWRGATAHPRAAYGAWFGTAFDGDGLAASKVYYELQPSQIRALSPKLQQLVQVVLATIPQLVPIFTSIRCGRNQGKQRVTFYHRGPLQLRSLGPLLGRLGLDHQLAGVMQIIGLVLGGRFELPDKSVLLGLSETGEGPELKLEVMLGMISDLPPGFLDLLSMCLCERPRQLRALSRWLRAFTPRGFDWPGNFSVLSVRVTPRTGARVALYLRPAEFEVSRRLRDIPSLAPGRERSQV